MIKINRNFRIQLGYIGLGLCIITLLIGFFYLEDKKPIQSWSTHLQFGLSLVLLISLILLFNFNQILFDNREYIANDTKAKLVQKIRFRGVLFNNIAIILFLLIIAIIIISFREITKPFTAFNKPLTVYDSLSLRISATVVLIFLVQILFRVFKYLLRVAAFYNARADAIELDSLSDKLLLKESMDLFTPDKYDISELENSSVFGELLKIIKGK
ncbi:MAG TPA: hypothetical protein PKN96_11560 [Flavobacterium sp.]|uniref:hypothetical protein n=1 Tax=Flavobacterium sp. TaxID=239 RepID=UPI002BCB845A|nr:hypothetical protein [Flavobacterium sp.]HNP33918.1 hypothetical protein [Flavobacterium sp.]